MFRRLCLFLLTLCLALPATAAPLHCAPLHCAPPMAIAASQAHAHHGKSDAPARQAAKHDCIGCIASFATNAPPRATQLVPSATQRPLDDLLLARLTSGPDTPPPRA